ncbi:hypothetical protein L0P88_09220 [Muricauda sp. SCSIO 64092]|uniref:hypothetical protein n=1 Tax=Allomuricauda sp. SCSIO 64092 TaxID=2908842 RepID=UPI001FF3769E|nr:hypothetical protein [Muricauda sp. SCSIO 64092]UOY08716.1 hypothetical protein L0P88_09220 [Muricauda sp. SCSIO 64092]
MKTKIVTGFLLLLGLVMGCSEDDNDPELGCFQEEGRRIVGTVDNGSGTIGRCISAYTIAPNMGVSISATGLFAPCNLTEEFQEEGINVVFSGFIYESFETEDICADFFEITEIR